jgi:hypothetical protein
MREREREKEIERENFERERRERVFSRERVVLREGGGQGPRGGLRLGCWLIAEQPDVKYIGALRKNLRGKSENLQLSSSGA